MFRKNLTWSPLFASTLATSLPFSQKAENLQRASNGDPPLDDDLSKHALFKPMPAPSRTDRVLLCQQLQRYCGGVDAAAGVALPKLFALEALAQEGALNGKLSAQLGAHQTAVAGGDGDATEEAGDDE